MDIEYKLNNFAALETESNDKELAKTKREQIKQSISECTTKIMNTGSFRKLAGKTQVILSMSGPDVRTRLTHTIEVAKIAKDICIKLGLNADIAEAMSLAHDIGHTPFGHVGERTLAEIMCGCDTLGEKIRDYDFINSGFKHNLQTFRVLNDLECVNGNRKYKKIWDLIFWGATAHTKMTYAKTISGMDDEILISANHCPWVYVCHYHEKKECRRNIQNKKGKKDQNGEEICKPWYCAKLPIMKSPKQVKDKRLVKGEEIRDYLKSEPIDDKYWEKIYCFHKCYLAKLWKFKLEDPTVYKKYPYLFDHPFPNTFYTNSIAKYFKDKKDYISLESLIVHQADEIAQRQQDLEDGINKGLLTFEDATKQISELISKFDCPDSDQLYDLKISNNSEDLGKLLADFYKTMLINQTRHNFLDFIRTQKIIEINIYSLMSILYSFEDKEEKKTEWIIEELKIALSLSHPPKKFKNNSLEKYFKINFNPGYFYLFIYDHLEKCTKHLVDNFQINEILQMLSGCISLLGFDLDKPTSNEVRQSKITKDLDKLHDKLSANLSKLEENYNVESEYAFLFIKTINSLRDYLLKRYPKESDDFFKKEKKGWKTIGWLQLSSFHALKEILTDHKKKNTDIIFISDIEKLTVQEDYNPNKHDVETFKIWKETLRGGANQVLSNIVDFIDQSNKKHDKRKKALNVFESKQRNTILKSEIVEKNDGKASYIIRRLFKAYISNSHQLPDSGLKYILTAILDNGLRSKLFESEQKALELILAKLEKTMLKNASNMKQLKEISKYTLLTYPTEDKEFKSLMKGKSNEIKAALEKRKELSKYFKELKDKRDDIKEKINSEIETDKNEINGHFKYLREILDNSILNATNFWETILTRAICDYIASLTDQEAVNEYEKLYAGIMELV